MGHGERVHGAQACRLEPQRAVRVRHALRRAGRRGGVHQGGGRVFGEGGPGEDGAAAVEKLLIARRANSLRNLLRGFRDGVEAGEHDRLYQRAVCEQAAEFGREARVGDHDFRLGVVDNVGDLVLHELDIQRREDRALRGDGEHHLEVLGAVVHEGGHALVAVDPQVIVQCVGERPGARANVRKRAFLCAGRAPGGALGGPVGVLPVVQNLRD